MTGRKRGGGERGYAQRKEHQVGNRKERKGREDEIQKMEQEGRQEGGEASQNNNVIQPYNT